MKRKKRKKGLWVLLFVLAGMLCGCQGKDNATSNKKMTVSVLDTENSEEPAASEDPLIQALSDSAQPEATTYEYTKKYDNAIEKKTSIYDCDIEADRKSFDGKTDIVVGDNFYATQINDWYENFKDYEDKVVEIEGYYIDEFAPYTFIGRYGPSCPYCQGGYVSFEFVTNENLDALKSGSDWIKLTGILRKGMDTSDGDFYYIEALDLEKMDKVGKDTVTN